MIKVLVADDDELTLRILCKIVQDMDLVPIACADGATAWNVLKANPDIAFIITDMQMPELPGRDLIEKLRANEQMRDLPVIIVSGVVRLREIKDLLDAGASYFLPKPIERKDLESYVVRLLNKQVSSDATLNLAH